MNQYVKRTQRDYSLSFKLAVVEQVEKGEMTYRQAQDRYGIQGSHTVMQWLKENPKFRVIYQPVCSPWVNHVERLWQALHDTITRNHQCSSMWQLLKKIRHFMETASPFPRGKHGVAKV